MPMVKCPVCGGTGQMVSHGKLKPCSYCKGHKQVWKSESGGNVKPRKR